MDPIGSITKITGQVLRRIADAIDHDAQAVPGVTIHIDVVHMHGATPHLDPSVVEARGIAERTLRQRVFGR